MRVFVSADMEGISSVAGWSDVTPGSLDYQQACHWVTQDVNAAIQGALEAGAETILVNDGHWYQRNIIPDELDVHAELIRGYTKPLGLMEGIDRHWDAAFFVGYHTRLGIRDGLMGHTLSDKCFRDVRLNGHPVSEAELNAAIAGEFSVPVVMISGDSALEREVKTFLPGVPTVVVKTSLEYETTVLLHPTVARQRIVEAARLGLERASAIAPYRIKTPCLVEAEFQNVEAATLASSVPTVSRVDDSTVRFEAEDMATAMRVLKVFLKLGSS
jgi:D-amino peptidase